MATRRTLRIEGGGPPLVVDVHEPERARGAVLSVHGFASGRRSTKNQALAERLPELGFRVLAPDLQGHGDSGGAFEELTVARSIGDLRRVAALPEYRDAPVRVLAGSSFGGLVAAWAAAEDPALCHGALLIAPAFGFLERYLPELSEEERAAWRAGRAHVVRLENREVRLGNGVLAEIEPRRPDRLAPSLRVPTLIVHGTEDGSVPWEASRDFVAACPRTDLELVTLDGADHRLSERLHDLLTHAERFLGAVAESVGGAPS